MVIREQDFSIVDTHEPVIAAPLSPACVYVMDTSSYKKQIFLVGRHQEVR
jgi:hypothetical protein